MNDRWRVVVTTTLVGVGTTCALATMAQAQVPTQAPAQAPAQPSMHVAATTEPLDTAAVFGRWVSVDVDDVSLSRAIERVAAQGHVHVQYHTEVVEAYRGPVTLHVNNVSLRSAFERILEGTRLRAVVLPGGDVGIVDAAPRARAAQAGVGVVMGLVMDSATQKGVSDAVVAVQQTKLSTRTDASGRFLLRDVPVGKQVLSVKSFGYRAQVRAVTVADSGRVVANITLAPLATMLSGVVTTVTGKQQKLEVGNDITTINVDSVMRTAPITSVTDLLETRVPGLVVQRTSGLPGAPSRIRLRGIGGGLLPDGQGASNDPIVVVDGIRIYASQSSPVDQNLAPAPGQSYALSHGQANYNSSYPPPSALDQIDPNSIETIEVLKGPSAAAMYGSDAANGVIVITTKRGEVGHTHYALNVDHGIQFMPGVYAAPGYYPFAHLLAGNFGPTTGTPCTIEQVGCLPPFLDSLVRFQALDDPRLSTIGRGRNENMSLTVSGGSNALTYSLTGSGTSTLGLTQMPPLYQEIYRDLYGATAPQWMRRPDTYGTWGLQANFVAVPSPNLRATLVTSYTNGAQQQTSGNLTLSTLASTYFDTTAIAPVTIGQYAQQVRSQTTVSNTALSLNWTAWRMLPITGTAGISTSDRQDRTERPYGIIAPSATGAPLNSDSLGYYSMGRGTNVTTSGTLVGTLFPSGRISIPIGLDVNQTSAAIFQATADSLAAGVSVPTVFSAAGQQDTRQTTAGWFIQPQININSRFFVNPGFRFDGGSNSGTRNTFSLFPKMNFSWVAVDRESEAPLWGFLSLLRPRLAVGIAGVQPAPNWNLRVASLSALNSPSNTTNLCPTCAYLQITSLGNTKLHPERSREIEGGGDVQLWGSRVSFSATYSHKLRIDAIEALPVAPSVFGGYLSFYTNIGKVLNTSTELSLSALVVDLPDLGWSVTASMTRQSNKLLTLNDTVPYIDMGNGTRLVPGYPLDGRWSRPILGYTSPGPSGRLAAKNIAVGDSAVYVGRQMPNFDFPISTTITTLGGRLSFNATFEYQDGLTQDALGSQAWLTNLYLNPTSSLATQAAALAASCYVANSVVQTGACTDYGMIQTVNTLRFTSASIGYTVPKSVSLRFGVPSMTVALQGSNLGLWTNYRGKDPNVNGVTVGEATQDTGQLPQPRTVSLSVRLGN